VISYPEVIKNNVDALRETDIPYYHPFLPLSNKRKFTQRLAEVLKDFGIANKELKQSVNAAYAQTGSV
jgi:predicted nucleotide-binding protein (sugar kinase/HSP70/actin superfamily)